MSTKGKGWKLRGDCDFEAAISRITPHQKLFLARPERNAAFVGGMGCVSAETVVAGVPVAEHRGGFLPTLVGPRYSHQSFRKGIADLYRVSTQSGRTVVVTLQHRFLSLTGWCPLADLRVGDAITADGSVHACEDWGTPSDSLDSYASGLHRCGESLPSPWQAAQCKSPQSHTPVVCESASELYTRLSTADSSHRAGSANREAAVRRPSASIYGVPLLQAWYCPPERIYMLLPESASFPPLDTWPQFHPLAVRVLVDGTSSSISTGDSIDNQTYVRPYWDIISNIQYVRQGQFYDLTVPSVQHYAAQGLYHHNSGKS